MLDVDGQVVSAADLVARVEQLLASIGSRGELPDRTGPGPAQMGVSSAQARGDRLAELGSLRARMQPPRYQAGRGLRGLAAGTVKGVIAKLVRWYVEPRFELQSDFDANTIELASNIHQELGQLQAQIEELRRLNAAARMQFVSAHERVGELRRRLDQVASESATLAEVSSLRQEVTSVVSRLGTASLAGADIDYVAFEDRFRGSTDQLREAQARYVSLFPPGGVPGKIVDIGCGRGEMLELLAEAGHEVLGLDLDPGMVRVCEEKGLPVAEGDAISALERMEDNSLKGVFCAQVVEHLLTSELEQLVRLAAAKLAPEGVLVIETINPRSSFALGDHFFADTTHVRPVHPETLRFMCEQVGFSLVQMEERSPHPMLDVIGDLPEGQVGAAVEALVRSVFGYQDYVIAATK